MPNLVRVAIAMSVMMLLSSQSMARNFVTKTAQVVHVESHDCVAQNPVSGGVITDCPYTPVPSGAMGSLRYAFIVLKIDDDFYGFTLDYNQEDGLGNIAKSRTEPGYGWSQFAPYGKLVSLLYGAQASNTPIEVVLDAERFANGVGNNATLRQIKVGNQIQKLSVCWWPGLQEKCAPYDDPSVASDY